NDHVSSADAPTFKSDDDTREIRPKGVVLNDHQPLVNTISIETENSNDTPEQTNLRCDDTLATNISDNTSNSESKSLEDKEVDKFLNSKYKEKVSNEIIQSIKEKRFREQETIITSQDTVPIITREQGFIQELSAGNSYNDASLSVQDHNSISSDHITEISLTSGQEKLSILQNIAHLYEKACDAEDESVKVNQAETLCWSSFIIVLDKSLDEIMNRDKDAHSAVSITHYSSDDLSETETSIPTESIPLDSSQENDQDSELPEAEVNTSTKETFRVSNSSQVFNSSGSADSKKLPEAEISEESKKKIPETEVSIPTIPSILSTHISCSSDFSGASYYYDLSNGKKSYATRSEEHSKKSIHLESRASHHL
ncbi:9091_t:CDS:2, partial [Diversispora eburnea]